MWAVWEGLDPELKALVVKCAMAAVAFASVLAGLIGRKVYAYVEIIGDARIAEARAAATRRLALAGEIASASTEEETRGTGIKGEAKAEIAAGVAAKLLEVPAQIDGLKASDPTVQAAVRAGVAKLRASLPAPSTYALTQSQVPQPIDVTVTGSIPKPARVPTIEERPTPQTRKAPAPKQGG